MYLLKKDFGFTNNLDFLSALLTLSERVGRTSLSEYVKIQHGLKAPVPYNATFLRGSTKKTLDSHRYLLDSFFLNLEITVSSAMEFYIRLQC